MPVLGVKGALDRINQKVEQRGHQRAVQGSSIATALHPNAPRGGTALNLFGQRRSAPGEPPAEEWGNLKQALQDPPQPIPSGYAFTVNRVQLELGTRHIAPRPMGAMTIAQLKRDVSGGSP